LLSAELSCGQPTSGNLLGNFAIYEQKSQAYFQLLLFAELSCGQPTSGNLLGNFAIYEQKSQADFQPSLIRKNIYVPLISLCSTCQREKV
jgi:hypothetical protein